MKPCCSVKVGDKIGGHLIESVVKRHRPATRTQVAYDETRYVIRCPECGNIRDKRLTDLYRNKIAPCKQGVCYYKNRKKALVGRRFGKLVVRSLIEANVYPGWKWDCVCDCGKHRAMKETWLNKPNGMILACASCAHVQANDGRRLTNWGRVHGQYKCNATRKKRKFALSVADIERLCSDCCTYCGCLPTGGRLVRNGQRKLKLAAGMERWRTPMERNGIDRIDAAKGYTISNCVPCCSDCNWAKSNMSTPEFLEMIKKIYTHSIEKRSTTIPSGEYTQAGGNGTILGTRI